MPASPNRLFFALWPDGAKRRALADAGRLLHARLEPGGRLERPERLHATLLFLGDAVPAEQERAALRVAARLRGEPFTLTLDRAGCFPRKQGLWLLSCLHTPAAAAGLHEQLRAVLRDAGVAYDLKGFIPHVTFLRDAQRGLPPTPIPPIDWRVDEFVLVRSLLQKQPAEYELIGRWPLGPVPAEPAGSAQLELWKN